MEEGLVRGFLFYKSIKQKILKIRSIDFLIMRRVFDKNTLF